MSNNIVEELPAKKHAPAPAAKASGGDSNKSKGNLDEASAKRIRQAVYDIRYRARREDIDLKAAYSQYMGNSSLSQAERTAVKEKLFGKEGGGVKEQVVANADGWASDTLSNALYTVFVEEEDSEIELAYLDQLDEEEQRKYKVRVKDNSGKSYVRYATREKISQLRSNPNIVSVEMTEHGEPYEGNRKKKSKKVSKKLDPVGKEDADIDNDGKPNDKNDKYLRKRRKAIGNAIKTRAEGLIIDAVSTEGQNKKKITGEGVNNKNLIKVYPDDGSEKLETKTQFNASYAHKQMLDTLAEKAECAEKSKKKKKSSVYEEKKEEKEEKKDMRGYYAKINVIKNKIRAQGVKNPCVIADPDDVEKSWNKEKTEDVDEGVKEIAKNIVKGVQRAAAGVANWSNEEQAAAQEDGAKVRELKKNPKYKWGRGK
tara:strand:+ start:1721 stop:3001 length:1281 start_codon:yes stop_codon:yes gene_type:complete